MVITDRRFYGGCVGFVVGHVAPEAAVKGPLAALRNGDIVVIDPKKNHLSVELAAKEIAARLKKLKPFVPKINTGVLAKYALLVSSASQGAVTSVELVRR